LKKIFKSQNLLTVLELIAHNIKQFKAFYPKGCLEITGRINGENNDSLPVREGSLSDRSMQIKISVTRFQKQDCIILVISDQTQRDLISRLEGVNEYKINLLASFSHEIRTPLNANLNFLETSMDHNDMTDSLKSNHILPAFRSAKLLSFIISDILDYSQLCLNKISLKVNGFNLRTLVNQAVDLFRMQIFDKGLKVMNKVVDDMEIKNDAQRVS
jgi:signal transduction histidine kinase